MNQNLDLTIYSEKSYAIQNRSPQTAKLLLIRTLKSPSLETQQSLYQNLANMLFYSKKSSASIMSWKRLCVISPQDWGNWLNLITALLAIERPEQAFYFVKKALIFHPNISNLHLYLINTLEKLDKFNQIEDVYQEISEKLKSDLLVAELYFKAGEVFLGSERIPQARSHFKRAVEIVPDKHIYSFKYGMALYNERLLKEALIQFEHCLIIDPTDKNSINNIAFINYSLGNIHTSLENFEYILNHQLETRVTYSNLIMIKFHLNGNSDDEEINGYKENLKSCIFFHGSQLRSLYKTELKFAEVELQNGPNEQAKKFISTKIKSLNFILSVIRELQLAP